MKHAKLIIVSCLLLVGSACSSNAVGSGGGSPPPGKISLVVIGDYGEGTGAQQRIAHRMCLWHRHHPFATVITTGDNVYPNGSPQYFRQRFVHPYRCLLHDGVRFHAVLGNHDVMTKDGEPELHDPVFGMPARNYVLDEGPIRFLMWDSNALNRTWLRKALSAPTKAAWTVVVFHHPVVSPGNHGPTPDLLPWMPRLLAKSGVDLVLNGHDHIYSVSKPLAGVRYVVTGGGGATLYDCHPSTESRICVARNHFLYLRGTRDQIRISAIPESGPAFDRFTIRSGSQP